jgi:hypothetical protein
MPITNPAVRTTKVTATPSAREPSKVDLLITKLKSYPKDDQRALLVDVWDRTVANALIAEASGEKLGLSAADAKKLDRYAVELGLSTPQNPVTFPHD